MTVPTVGDLFELESPTSEAVAAARLTMFAAAVGAPQRLGPWTDEELVGLDDPGRPPSAPSPWYSSLAPAEQEVALTAALRGLTARGLYRADPVDAATGTFTYRALPEVLALLTMRRATDRVVVAERRSADRVDWALAYAQRAGLWLLELVDHVGVHGFVLCTGEEAAEALTAWSGAVEGPVPDLDVVLSRAQVSAGAAPLEAVGRSTLAVTITPLVVDGPATQDSSGLFTGPDGSYLSTASADGGVGYRGADRAAVRAHWAAALGRG
ncbi:hypothetical protein GTR02_19090 [Kineococcus sp. R8]|uniref:hypothetical protein n=1 Tax=Kineococcus siccus TaxID=2696567 RepID=UPI0014130901|nr:hypothetical protein [Kineococcus siccus]NAZ83921.1 hypothetical protein [Kineococcus siccus]